MCFDFRFAVDVYVGFDFELGFGIVLNLVSMLTMTLVVILISIFGVYHGFDVDVDFWFC